MFYSNNRHAKALVMPYVCVCVSMPKPRSFGLPRVVGCHLRYHIPNDCVVFRPPSTPLLLLPPLLHLFFSFFTFGRLVAAGELGVGRRFRANRVVYHGVGVNRDGHMVTVSA